MMQNNVNNYKNYQFNNNDEKNNLQNVATA